MSRACALALRLGLSGLCLCAPAQASGQFLFDLSAAWGPDEHTMDMGAGWSPFTGLSLVGGVALLEHGLQPGYEWSADRTRVIKVSDPTLIVDPRDARTNPSVRGWARLEYQPQWWGFAAMWDPRNHPAIGAFGSLHLTDKSELIGEVRWVHTLGHDLSARLRWR